MKAQAPVHCSFKNCWHSAAFCTTDMNSNRRILDSLFFKLMNIPVKAFQTKCVLILFIFEMDFLIIYRDPRPVTSLLCAYRIHFNPVNEMKRARTSNHINDILKLNKTIEKYKGKKKQETTDWEIN